MEKEKEVKARWVYVGRRLTEDVSKALHCFQPLDEYGKPTGKLTPFSKMRGYMIGGIYEITYTLHEDGKISIFIQGEKAPRFVDRGEFDAQVEWETEDERATVRLAGVKREKKAATEPDALEKLLRPVLLAMQKTDSTGRTLIKINVLNILDRYFTAK